MERKTWARVGNALKKSPKANQKNLDGVLCILLASQPQISCTAHISWFEDATGERSSDGVG